jgi:NAD(P)-dependent dehydrogenase (short-subunit alcohol dehydrogenase family)
MGAVPVVFITGAAGGVGRAIGRRFAADGYAVAAAGRAQGPLDELARDLARTGAHTATVLCDVTDAGQVQGAVADAERQLGPLDVLVNNAGASDSAPFVSTDDGLWERMLAVNLTGTYHVMRAVAPGMFARGRGRMINIASSAGKVGFAYTAAYAAAKHGVLGLTRSVAIEAAPHGVTVNAICPGWIDTPMTDTSIARIVEKTGRNPEEARRALERMNPQGRLIQPEEVAALAAFLAGPDAHGINGQAFDL